MLLMISIFSLVIALLNLIIYEDDIKVYEYFEIEILTFNVKGKWNVRFPGFYDNLTFFVQMSNMMIVSFMNIYQN